MYYQRTLKQSCTPAIIVIDVNVVFTICDQFRHFRRAQALFVQPVSASHDRGTGERIPEVR